jgi:hypothetical protein
VSDFNNSMIIERGERNLNEGESESECKSKKKKKHKKVCRLKYNFKEDY